uniref:NADH-ubiquinone oxidoreductase chain 2 n=1 Tax=Anacestra spiniger TaxID=2813426 RepID=A0A8T9ZXW0_9HEMI|nr:NADH dehydrogenase subunit 2 [Anacestra spiniger]
MNSSKLLFLMIMLMSTLIVMSSTSWIGMWMGMEINLLSFIPLISSKKNMKDSQAMMMYFLVQSISSMLFLFSILMSSMMLDTFLIPMHMKMLIMISIMIKLGTPPFHMWYPEMMSRLNWTKCLILMTWQKLAPLTVMSNLISNNWFTNFIIMITAFMGGLGGLNQTSIRKLMAYSSINHMAWMLMFMSINVMWYNYFIIYSMITIMLVLTMKNLNIYFMNQFYMNNSTMTQKIVLSTMLFSMGGLPPFMGFLPKLIVVQMMINSSLYFMMISLLLTSLITLFYYIRMITPIILYYSTMNKWINPKKLNLTLNIIFITNLFLPLILIFSFF